MPDKTIRDPLWNNIRVDPLALSLVDTPPFQRLRYVRQLGLAFLVYPGASHSRFEHALGTYHLAQRALLLLREHGAVPEARDAEASRLVRTAALLHDIGHYPFSHALEEIGVLHHEEVARPLVTTGPVAHVLECAMGAGAPEEIMRLIRGKSSSALQGLISGSLDLDKIEYLKRDAVMCGVSYGDVDTDRLLNSLVVVDDPETGRGAVGISEKGLSALESMLFAKYQMYRNVYWHHAVRSATAMYKRLVADALEAGSLDARALAAFTDEGLLLDLGRRASTPLNAALVSALRERRLYKRSLECPAADLPNDSAEWIADDYALTVAVENLLAAELGLTPGELLLDYPAKTQMLGLDMLVLGRDGSVQRLAPREWTDRELTASWGGTINLPRLSHHLYRSARWLRVFTKVRIPLPSDRLLALVARPAAEVRDLLARGTSLLN